MLRTDFLWFFSQVDTTKPQWWLFCIDSDNGVTRSQYVNHNLVFALRHTTPPFQQLFQVTLSWFCYTYILVLYSIACNVWKHRGGELTNQNIVPQIRSAPVLPKMQRTLNRHHYHHPEVVPNTQNAWIEGFLPSTCGAANGIWYWITHNIGRTL